MKDRYDIFCVGACVQDILIEGISPEGFQRHLNVLDKVVFTSGGDAVNEAAVLSKLGNRVALFAQVDNGPVGKAICADLLNAGVDTSKLVKNEQSRSSTSFVCINESGEHTFFLDKGINEGIGLEQIDLSLLDQTRALSVGSLYSCAKLDKGGVAELMKAAKSRGLLTFADMDHDVEVLGPHAMDIVYPFIDYLMPSIEEAVYVTGETDEKGAARRLLEKGAGTVVIKLGGQGCYVRTREKEFYEDPFEVVVTDTTGCGDNFVAGFIHSILKGMSLEEGARFACAAGALNAQMLGGHIGIVSETQVETFMKNTMQRRVCRE
ncbi:carbohydrate kinase family protein [Eubacterium sp. ER2]|uniref:carbohydrate kinase family protein n=1 Tax=Eubacterium sp. ER2 TaxID=1519438 RepID=UPI00051C6EEF|nr:carbohydrate kinase family protein [Eubacterium sp. ER2]